MGVAHILILKLKASTISDVYLKVRMTDTRRLY